MVDHFFSFETFIKAFFSGVMRLPEQHEIENSRNKKVHMTDTSVLVKKEG